MEVQLCLMSVTTTAEKCLRLYLQRVAGLLAIIAVSSCCPNFANLGLDSVVVLPKDKPLPDEIARDLDCWIGVWVQKCDCCG